MSAPRWAVVGAAGLCGGGAALLHFLSFPPADLAAAAYVCLLPLILWLLTRPGRRLVLWTAALSGWATWFALLFWLRHFTETSGLPAAVLLGWLLTAALAAIVGGFWFAWVLLAAWALPRAEARGVGGRLLTMLGLAGAWIFLEWVRSWFCTGFPWLPLAASQWERPLLLQICAWTGAWGLSGLLVFFNLGCAFYVRHLLRGRPASDDRGALRPLRLSYRLCPEFYAALGALGLAIVLGLDRDLFAAPDEPVARVGVVQPYLRPEIKWDPAQVEPNLASLSHLTEAVALADPNLILWPEAPTPYPVVGHAGMRRWAEELSATVDAPLLMGNLAVERGAARADDRWYNGVCVVDPDTGLSPEFFGKRRLVPFGEYVPLARWFPFIEKAVPLEGSFSPGTRDDPLPLTIGPRRWKVGPLVCYEDLFPALARDSARRGADFLFVATNNAWYGEEAGAYQHAAHSVLRAVETGRPVLRCGNGGWSGWIDAYGRVREVVTGEGGTIYFRGTATFDFARHSAKAATLTPYVRHGDWIVAAAALAAAWMVWRLRRA